MSDSNSGQFPDPWAQPQDNQDGVPAPDTSAFPAPPPPDPAQQANQQPNPYGQPAAPGMPGNNQPGAPGYAQPGAPGYAQPGGPAYSQPGGYASPPPPGYIPTPAGYGPPPGVGGPQPYGQPGYPQPTIYTAPPPTSTPASTIVLLVLSAILTVSCYFSIPGLAPLVIAIVAMTKSSSDPAQCKKLTKIGWIVFAVMLLLYVGGIIALLVIARDNNSY